MFAFGTNVWLSDEAVTVRDAAGVSASAKVKGNVGVAASSFVVWLPIDVMVGASFTELTVSVNEMEVTAVPSLTLIVINVLPL